jgi:uncharacterized membrane protein (DUF485 family)
VVVVYWGWYQPNVSHPYVLSITSVVIGYVISGLIAQLADVVFGSDSDIFLMIYFITPLATTPFMASIYSMKANGENKSDANVP